MTDIADRTAFITGGANGIGLGIARSLAQAGARLALVDLDAAALARAEMELCAITDVFTAVLDVRDRDGYARVADEAEAKLGPVSILINNAGVSGGTRASRLTYELWDWGIGINLGGVINGVQTFLPRIIERGGGGHIVNTASGAGLVPPVREGSTLYTTAKYAVVGMSEALGLELESQGIGVTVLCPGPVATGIIERALASRAAISEPISAEQLSKTEAMKTYLANGMSPDAVGDMVREAIYKNRLYVHTHREVIGRIEARTKALLDAMPREA
ncbi:short-chain dehydrogenase/reductase SDR [Parvibaculum lavamentivorans DS-1]|uniref:Short-chain dehydrogenase/reductase SDR n=1 Tax=Parvibaculum lavamentivorans (strain DS-1 / DSM 13023 / NCIMB 13966) TaxID=402881 RepID=A7HRW0_PARL1|nr:SDR family NAD(P)-dependent oxidoreductase [Parvibaculum lavamentivorans]ABS62643.1 short-chain dehydrogenase/reductase SDR [Parvibaculum lavamentivorans DS-1]